MKSKSIAVAIILALGAIIAACALRNGIIKVKSMERTVAVKGLAEEEVPADKVVWRISFSRQGDGIQELYSSAEKDATTITNYLKTNGLEDNEIFASSPSIVDNEEAYSYRTNRPQYKYSINSSLTVSSGKIDNILKLQKQIAGVMIRQGIAINDYAYFNFTRLGELKPKMIEDATKNARSSAQKFADDSHSKIGKIKTANQGVFSIDDLDETTPYMKKVRVVTTVVYYLD